jgi:hypothetical protein
MALFNNETGNHNTATGVSALNNNPWGSDNTATGYQAVFSGGRSYNTGTGYQVLYSNTGGDDHTAVGYRALYYSRDGWATQPSVLMRCLETQLAATTRPPVIKRSLTETAATTRATVRMRSIATTVAVSTRQPVFRRSITTLAATTSRWGLTPATTSRRVIIISILATVVSKTFIAGIQGVAVTGRAVVVSSTGQLGVAPSSARFKDEIKPMDKASEAILALKPVSFRYKKELDPDGIQQFGLLAEEVEKVNPDLIARDEEGKIMSVRYEAVNAMLLNEFLKEHRKVERLEATVAQQHKDFEAALADLKGQIEKVSAQLEVSKPAPQVAAENP